MDLYCILCGTCSWNKLRNISNYDEYISVCKNMSEAILKNKNITDARLLNNQDNYKNMKKYIDEKTFNKIKKNMDFMDNITILASDEIIIKNAEWIDRNTYVDMSKDESPMYYVYPSYYETLNDKDKNNFVGAKFIHSDCYNYIKKKLIKN